MVYFEYASLLVDEEAFMEQKPRARYDEFADQFTSVLHEHWSDILQVISRQSPRIAALLRVATPSGLKRVNGSWHISVMIRRVVQRDKLRQPRDNEIVAQAIRLWARSAAQLKLPRVTVDFEL
jgi:hypothetical protein